MLAAVVMQAAVQATDALDDDVGKMTLAAGDATYTPAMCRWIWMVYSLLTTSSRGALLRFEARLFSARTIFKCGL